MSKHLSRVKRPTVEDVVEDVVEKLIQGRKAMRDFLRHFP
jgi:hypothetical protein